jgi:ubiquinone/menaquinone biosynthesis C-methylase UbiE
MVGVAGGLDTWKALWHERGLRHTAAPSLARRAAIDANGFDWGPGFLEEAAHAAWATDAIKLLELDRHLRVLDCGSGAGALSSYLSEVAPSCVSLDYSQPLLALGSRLGTVRMPVAAEAGRLPFRSGVFDRVLCNSVFQYFPTLAYAEGVVQELLRISRPVCRIVIMDVLDAALKDAAVEARLRSTRKAQQRGSADLTHLYYERAFFAEQASRFQCTATFTDHVLSPTDYEHAPFRFHVVIARSA